MLTAMERLNSPEIDLSKVTGIGGACHWHRARGSYLPVNAPPREMRLRPDRVLCHEHRRSKRRCATV